MAAVRARKRAMVSGLNEMYLENYKQTGAELIFGTGRFIGPKTLEAALPGGGIRRFRGTNVIVSAGTRDALDAVPAVYRTPRRHLGAPYACRRAVSVVFVRAFVIGKRRSAIRAGYGARTFLM
jgi:hypothetical protein